MDGNFLSTSCFYYIRHTIFCKYFFTTPSSTGLLSLLIIVTDCKTALLHLIQHKLFLIVLNHQLPSTIIKFMVIIKNSKEIQHKFPVKAQLITPLRGICHFLLGGRIISTSPWSAYHLLSQGEYRLYSRHTCQHNRIAFAFAISKTFQLHLQVQGF